MANTQSARNLLSGIDGALISSHQQVHNTLPNKLRKRCVMRMICVFMYKVQGDRTIHLSVELNELIKTFTLYNIADRTVTQFSPVGPAV